MSNNQNKDGTSTVEMIVNGAQLKCSLAAESVHPVYLAVPEGSGAMQDGKSCANDQNYIPFKNVQPFAACHSLETKEVLTILSASATAEQKKRYDAALQVIKHNETASRYYTPVPCTLPLLKQWFDADEKEIVTDSMGMEIEIKLELMDIERKTAASLKDALNLIEAKIEEDLKESMEPGGRKADIGEYLDKKVKLKKIKKELDDLCLDLVKTVDTESQIDGNVFKDTMKHQLDEAKKKINKITDKWDEAHQVQSKLMDYYDLRSELQNEVGHINSLMKKLDNWKESENHLLTMNSFLVCRCGGIITIADSGQSFQKVVDTLMSSILTRVREFAEQCRTGMVDYCDKAFDYSDHKWSSYKAAAEGLEYFEQMLTGPKEEKKIDVCVYLQLICHSYNDEIKKRLMSFLSLISCASTGLSIGLAVYDILTSDNVADNTSSSISLMEAAGEFEGSILYKVDNLYSAIDSAMGFFYVSYDTWVEDVVITVFTDTHAHVSESWLKKDGSLKSKKGTINMYTESDYIAGDMGRGLKWKEDPGVYINRVMHLGEDKNKHSEVDEGGKIKNEIPYNKGK